jgi:uncharacterized protein (TIGR02421 family)
MGSPTGQLAPTDPLSRPDAVRVRELSERLVTAQRVIRILDAVAWDESVEAAFFARGGRDLPPVDRDYYRNRPLPFDPAAKRREFLAIERDAARRLGPNHPAGRILTRMCVQYRSVIDLLVARGTKRFGELSRELFGSTLRLEWGEDLRRTLAVLRAGDQAPGEEPSVAAEQVAQELSCRLAAYFAEPCGWRVRLDDSLHADASAGCSYLKVRRGATFRPGDLKLLEVHEGWVHLGTTLNGQSQPVCTFLGKGPPTSTRTQEGLAVLMELLTGAAHPYRMRRLANRLEAVALAEAGADFRGVYEFFREAGDGPHECYRHAARIFRGSLPAGCGPFTKDLCYAEGLVRVYRFLRSCPVGDASLLFAGKVALEDVGNLADLRASGLLTPARHVPDPFRDAGQLAERLAPWSRFGRGEIG